MLSCEECRGLLPQYIADGEPVRRAPAGLREHLAACVACRELAVRLRYVEGALLAYPSQDAPPALAQAVVAQITLPDARPPAEEWQWLPWDVWVPALALLLAVALASFSVPPHAFAPAPSIDVAPVTLPSGEALQAWLAGLRQSSGGSLFWVAWTAASIILAVLGMMVGLSSWRRADATAHEALHARVAHVTDWVGGLLGRAP